MGGIFDILSPSKADRTKQLILKAQANLLDLVNSHSSNSKLPQPPVKDELFPSTTSTSTPPSFPSTSSIASSSVDLYLLPEIRSLSPNTLLLPINSPSFNLPPLNLSSAWFSPSHPSHPTSTRKEPSLAEQHSRILNAFPDKTLGTFTEERRREEDEALGMELFRAVALGRLQCEMDKGFEIGDAASEEGWLDEEDGLKRQHVDMTSTRRKRKLMMSKHK